MKTFAVALMALATCSLALAQKDPGPSPTNSVGCYPHDDHWHCAGPATAAPSATSSRHDEQAPVTGNPVLLPSPTASVGCKPHGDHWHCDGPAAPTTIKTSPVKATSNQGQATLTPTVPSPTESVGCHPHGDHWHCDGPRETKTGASTSSARSNSTSPTTSTPPKFEGAAGALRPERIALFAVAAVVAYYI